MYTIKYIWGDIIWREIYLKELLFLVMNGIAT